MSAIGETAEQAKARFAEKDRLFTELTKSGEWPIKSCLACRYYACAACGHGPYYREGSCSKCGHALKQGAVCCKRDWHHVGDCCTHCGNDERKL